MTDERDQIEATRDGNMDAWEQLVRAHQQSIFQLAYLLLGDADDAEDVAQETFLRAYDALGRFDSERPLRPWLMRIATNLCHNWRRKIGRYMAGLQKLMRSEAPALFDPQQMETWIEAEMLWKAVRRLRTEDQHVLYLRYFLECSEIETAEILSVAPGTVKSRQHRALARLRVLLQKEYPQLVPEEFDGF